MQFWGILGLPVQHSLSPVIFNYIFQKFQLDYEYIHFEVEDQLLPGLIDSLAERNVLMLNVTHPFKNKIIHYCHRLDPIARTIYSVNLVRVEKEGLIGYNTDWYGALKTLEKNRIKPESVIILGSGGASRSVAYAMAMLNPEVRIWVVSRNPKYKHDRWEGIYSILKNRLHLIDYSDLEFIGQDKQMIINGTPLGLSTSQYDIPCDLSFLPKDAIVWDLVYNPFETQWLKLARERGLRTMNGLDMLIYQAEKGYSLITGRNDFPLDEIYELALINLKPELKKEQSQ